MTIPLVTTTGNYDLWIGRTNQAIGVINLLTDGVLTINGSIVWSNTSAYLNVSTINANMISVYGVDIGTGLRQASSNANAAYIQANAAYIQANIATNIATAAYGQANTVSINLSSNISIIQGIDNTQNTNIIAVNSFAQNAYNKANGNQVALGFTPVQQGGGTSQGNNKVYLGWDAANGAARVQVDGTDLGNLATTGYVNNITPGRLLGVQVLSGSGTFTPITGTNKVIVEAIGGGAAGGGGSSTGNGCGSGGGAGAYAKVLFTTNFNGVPYSVAGITTTTSPGSSGSNGNSTTFGNTPNWLSVGGGYGGGTGIAGYAMIQGGSGGVIGSSAGASSVFITVNGNAGQFSIIIGSGGAYSQAPGTGGPGPFGGMAQSPIITTSGGYYGSNGNGPGAGGSGGSGNGEFGGSGAAGALIVYQYS